MPKKNHLPAFQESGCDTVIPRIGPDELCNRNDWSEHCSRSGSLGT